MKSSTGSSGELTTGRSLPRRARARPAPRPGAGRPRRSIAAARLERWPPTRGTPVHRPPEHLRLCQPFGARLARARRARTSAVRTRSRARCFALPRPVRSIPGTTRSGQVHRHPRACSPRLRRRRVRPPASSVKPPVRQPNLAQRCPLSPGYSTGYRESHHAVDPLRVPPPRLRSTVQLSVEQFRDVREVDKRYAIVTGHPTMNGEHPVEVEGDVTIVQKP